MFEFDWKIYVALGFVFFLMALPVLSRKIHGTVSEVFAGELLKSDNNYQLIDLRKASEFKLSHIDKSINLPCNQAKDCAQQIVKMPDGIKSDSATILICETDIVSRKVCKQLMQLGYKNVFILKDGFNYWKRKRLPLIKA